MTESDDAAARNATLARLAQSRAEIRRWLEPAARSQGARDQGGGVPDDTADDFHDGSFPRSRTMRLLLSGRALGTVGALVGGLVLARPALALKLLRMLPSGALARMLVVKAVTALRARN